MRILLFSILFLSSCQGSNYLSNWFYNLKEYSLTHMASQTVNQNLSLEDKENLLDLFDHLTNISANRCDQIQAYIEDNRTLQLFETSLGLNRGFLFDGLYNYDYISSLLEFNRDNLGKATFSVVSVWKTTASLEEINGIASKIIKCYPQEYL